jgi:5-methyltetrahydropteroyltriglutamate--homocysteine methyltransferase
MERGVVFAEMQPRAEGARVAGPLGFSGHPMLEHFRFIKTRTSRTSKMTMPVPSALYGRAGRDAISPSAYASLNQFFIDLDAAYGKAARAFANVGCRYLQLDDPFIAMLRDPGYRAAQQGRGDDPHRLAETYADIDPAISDIPADMTITMHLCRGNYRSTYMGAGAYDAVADVLFNRIKEHGYFMEYDSERAGGFEPLRLLPKNRVAVLGLVTTKSGQLESKDEIKRRIAQAAKFARGSALPLVSMRLCLDRRG